MSATAVRSNWVGRVIDERFTLLEWLGGSGQSGVYLTELPGDPTQKATLKLIPADEEGEARVADWAAAADLSHPHLIKPLYVSRCNIDGNEFVYVVTEYAQEVLAEILPIRPLTPEEAKDLLVPVIDALSYLHRKGFVHHRLKPTNILVVGDDLKLSVDNVRAIDEPEKFRPALDVYDAPERAKGTSSAASDVWSLGITLVEALTQRAPDWNRSSTIGPAIPESVPQPFSGIARRCLQLDPALRCTPGDIKALVGLAPVQPEPTPHIDEEEPADGPRSAIPMGIVLVVVAMVAVALALFFMRSRQPQSSSSAPASSPAAASSSAPDQQQAQAPAPAQPSAAQPEPPVAAQQPPANPPQDQPKPQSSEPVPEPEPAQAQAPAQVPAPSKPTPVPAASAANGEAVKGAVIHRVEPDVLESATRSIYGTVRVRVRVSVAPDGSVSNASLDSAGPSRYFAKAALQAAQQWKFKPAQVKGQAARSEWVLQFQFTRDGSFVIPVEEAP